MHLIFNYSNGKQWSPKLVLTNADSFMEKSMLVENIKAVAIKFGRNRYGAELV